MNKNQNLVSLQCLIFSLLFLLWMPLGYSAAIDGMEFGNESQWTINAFLAANGGDWNAAQRAWEIEHSGWCIGQAIGGGNNGGDGGSNPNNTVGPGEGPVDPQQSGGNGEDGETISPPITRENYLEAVMIVLNNYQGDRFHPQEFWLTGNDFHLQRILNEVALNVNFTSHQESFLYRVANAVAESTDFDYGNNLESGGQLFNAIANLVLDDPLGETMENTESVCLEINTVTHIYLTMAGVENELVTSRGHAWVETEINGVPYVVDAAASTPIAMPRAEYMDQFGHINGIGDTENNRRWTFVATLE